MEANTASAVSAGASSRQTMPPSSGGQARRDRQSCAEPLHQTLNLPGMVDHRHAAKAALELLGSRQFHGSRSCSSCALVRPETKRSSTSVSHAIGSTPLSLAV